ncbi:MAG: CHAP domain-containing protein [Candidatus Shapirobacteria bacterium]
MAEEQLKQALERLFEEGPAQDRDPREKYWLVDREEEALAEDLLSVKGIDSETIRRIGRIAAEAAVIAASETLPEEGQKRLHLEKSRTSVEKKVNQFLRQQRVSPSLRRTVLRRLKRQPSVVRARVLSAQNVLQKALEREGLTSPGLLSAELVETASQEAPSRRSRFDNKTIKARAAIAVQRVKETGAAPLLKAGQAEGALRSAIRSSQNGEKTQAVLVRVALENPNQVKQIIDKKKKELLLPELEKNLGVDLSGDEQLSKLPDQLIATQTRANLYGLSVGREQIPQEVLTHLEAEAGERPSYSYEQVAEAINNQDVFTPERLEAIWPLLDQDQRLTFRGSLRLFQTSQQSLEQNQSFTRWHQNLNDLQKEKLGWLEGALGQQNQIVQTVLDNPIYQFKQKLGGAVNNLAAPVKNWFLQTGVGQAAQGLALKVGQKAAEFAVQSGAKKLLASGAAKAVAAGLSAALGVSTAGVSLLIQGAIMLGGAILKGAAKTGRKVLNALGVDSDQLRRNFGFLGGLAAKGLEVAAGIPAAIIKVPVDLGVPILVGLAGAIGLPIVLALMAFAVAGSSQRMSMEGGGRGDLSPDQIATLERGVNPEGDQLAVRIQRAFDACGLSGAITAASLSDKSNCLTGQGIRAESINVLIGSAQAYTFLQCVAFVRASVIDLPPLGDARDFADPPVNYPWQPLEDLNRVTEGQIVVWERGYGHMGVITKVEKGPDGTQAVLWVTQAWGDDASQGVVNTTKILVSEPDMILEYISGGGGGG